MRCTGRWSTFRVDAANAVPVVGTPLAYGIGFVVLLLIVFTESWAGSLTTVAHEGAHMVLAVLTFRGHSGFKLNDGGGAATKIDDPSWGVGDYLITFAGYAAPPLLGLGGAHLVRAGNPGGVLVIALILGLAAFFQARNQLAYVVTLLIVIVTGWTLMGAGAWIKVHPVPMTISSVTT